MNRFGAYGRWAFTELRNIHGMEEDFRSLVETRFEEAFEPFLPDLHVAAGHRLIQVDASRSDIEVSTHGEAER